ncbi:MAG: hypothetical protein R3181_11285 [Rubricoccaceae bacterium]|nr:hypothetical protein [Rubricoccaceae bacterium]
MNGYRRLVTLLFTLPLPALAQPTSSGIIDTGAVQFELFDNGELGAYGDTGGPPTGTGFVFGGINGLYEGTFLVGQSSTQVSGSLWERVFGTPVEWVPVMPVAPVPPPAGFDVALQTTYEDAAATGDGPIGLTVTTTAFARMGEPFVYLAFEIDNTSGEDLAGLYPGILADWDVTSPECGDHACLDDDTQLVYESGCSLINPNYYGQMALDTPWQDVTVTGFRHDVLPGDDFLFGSLSSIDTWCSITAVVDRRTVLGIGTFDIATGASETVVFAFVAGTSEDDILANAREAQSRFLTVSSEPSPDGLRAALHAARPNPARGSTTLSFSLDRPQTVRLSAHDALGREVAVLVDGVRAAGDHAVRWEASGLPAGVYLAHITAGGVPHARTVTLLR